MGQKVPRMHFSDIAKVSSTYCATATGPRRKHKTTVGAASSLNHQSSKVNVKKTNLEAPNLDICDKSRLTE